MCFFGRVVYVIMLSWGLVVLFIYFYGIDCFWIRVERLLVYVLDGVYVKYRVERVNGEMLG